MAAITIHPAQLDKAGSEVGARVMAATRAATQLHGLDVGVEMPPGVQGRVKASVDRAATALTSSVARIGDLSNEMLARSGQAEQADQIGAAFGGLLQAAGIQAGSLALGGKPEFGSALPAGALRWVKRAGVGLPVTGTAAAGYFSWAKHKDNPFLTAAQKREQVAGETGSSVLKTGAAMGATAATAGAVGGPPGIALGFVAGLATGVAVEILDKKLGLTPKLVDHIDETSDNVVAEWQWIKQADADAGEWIDGAAHDAKDWGATAAGDVAGAAEDAVGVVGRGILGGSPVGKLLP